MNQRLEDEADYFEAVFEKSAALQRRFGHVFSCPNAIDAQVQYGRTVCAAISGARVLEYGCAHGSSSAWLLENGAASVAGIDINESAIEIAKQRKLANAEFIVGDAHQLPWADNDFDVIIGNAILHHLDHVICARELARVIRPGGHIFFVEPLADNPLLRLYRWLTPAARTRYEAPLSRHDIERLDALLGRPDHFMAGLVSSVLGAITSVIPGAGPNNIALRIANRLDKYLAKTALRWWMRQVFLHWSLTKPTN